MRTEKYCVVTATSHSKFEELVNQKLEQKWQLKGDVVVQVDRFSSGNGESGYETVNYFAYFQAMVLPGKPHEPNI